MRTTLTVDDDIAKEMLRRGLAAGAAPEATGHRFVVKASPCGFLPGIDPLKLNQMADDAEIEGAIDSLRQKHAET